MKAPRVLISAAVALVVAAMPRVGHAQGLALTEMHVGARVAPACSIITGVPADDAGAIPSVRVICAQSRLRTLRVSTADAASLAALKGRHVLAGGEVVFTVLSPLTVVAGLEPLSSLPRSSEKTVVVVTLDF